MQRNLSSQTSLDIQCCDKLISKWLGDGFYVNPKHVSKGLFILQ